MKIKAAVQILPLFFSSLLMSSVLVLGAQTQAPGAGASVSVRMIDAVDSSKDPAGKQYRASVSKTVDAGNGVSILQGAVALVTLANDGSGYSAHLASVTINGQATSVTSSAASVTTGAQTAVGSAVHSINSVLGGFGHHVNAPSGVSAVAMGQRVVLPPGTTLTFVLTQPPAANPAAPAGQPMTAPAAPRPTPAAAAYSAGAPFISCSTSAGPGVDTYFTGVFQTTRPINQTPNGWQYVDQSILDDFHAYLTQKGYKFKPGKNTGCDVKSTEAEVKAAQHTRAYGGGGGLGENCCGNGKIVETGWTKGAAAAPEPVAAAVPAVPASAPAASSAGGQFIYCYTSAQAGMDTYFTGIFQTTRIKNGPPNGRYHVDQSIPSDFYAYLKQKGYNFKAGGNGGGCVVKRTEAEANAAQHATAYGGPGFLGVNCCGNGKVVETGWKE